MAERPTHPRIAGDPNITPATRTGAKTTAVTTPIICFISLIIRKSEPSVNNSSLDLGSFLHFSHL
jgi:hypothetical protein